MATPDVLRRRTAMFFVSALAYVAEIANVVLHCWW